MRFLVAALAALIASSHAVTVETSGGLSVSPCAVCKSLLGNDVFTPCEATKSKEKQEKKDAGAKLRCALRPQEDTPGNASTLVERYVDSAHCEDGAGDTAAHFGVLMWRGL